MVDIGKTLVDEVFQPATTRVVVQVQGQVSVMVSVGADGQWQQAVPQDLIHEAPPDWVGQGEYPRRI